MTSSPLVSTTHTHELAPSGQIEVTVENGRFAAASYDRRRIIGMWDALAAGFYAGLEHVGATLPEVGGFTYAYATAHGLIEVTVQDGRLWTLKAAGHPQAVSEFDALTLGVEAGVLHARREGAR